MSSNCNTKLIRFYSFFTTETFCSDRCSLVKRLPFSITVFIFYFERSDTLSKLDCLFYRHNIELFGFSQIDQYFSACRTVSYCPISLIISVEQILRWIFLWVSSYFCRRNRRFFSQVLIKRILNCFSELCHTSKNIRIYRSLFIRGNIQ